MLRKRTLFGLVAMIAVVACFAFSFVSSPVSVRAEESPVQSLAATTEIVEVTAESDASAYVFDTTENGFYKVNTLKSFVVPERAAGKYFRVVIPESVTLIMENAFVGTDNDDFDRFAGVEIVNVDTVIEQNAFADCNSLLEVIMPKAVYDNGVEGSGILDAPGVNVVFDNANKTLHVARDAIGEYVCVKNGAVQSDDGWVVLKYIGEQKSLVLPAASTLDTNCKTYTVYNNAFEGGGYTSVNIPNCVTALGDRAFYGCNDLKEINFALDGKLESIGAATFHAAKIKTLTVPKSVNEIGEQAFGRCTALTELVFESDGAGEGLTVGRQAFEGCTALESLHIPDKATVIHQAFNGCSSLRWVYVGNDCEFVNNAGPSVPGITFFPTDNGISFVYPSLAQYNKMKSSETQSTFAEVHGGNARYIVTVNFYVGADTEPTISVKRLSGMTFDYACNDVTGAWASTGSEVLPAQASHYASTVWYGERELTNVRDIDDVNDELADEAVESIALYCFQTVSEPALPQKPATWVYDSKRAYDVKSLSEVLKAMGSENEYSEQQLAALRYDIVYTDSDGKAAKVPDKISGHGVYKISITLDPKYGVWSNPTASTVTVSVDTDSFNTVLIIFLVIGGVALIVTVSTVIIRKKVQAKSRRKQISSKEAIERFKAAGGETTLEQ